MARDFPALNPFPAQATTAIEEGSFLESYAPWARSTPTLMLDPVRRMSSLVARFQSAAEVNGRRRGQAVVVHGEHGSGKTHAIRAAIGEVATESSGDLLLPLYVKLSGTDFVYAYRLLMAQLSLSELTGIALTFLGSLSRGGPLPLRSSTEFRRDPSVLLDMFNKHLVERGLLLQAQADRLQNVVQDESNFQRALTYLLEPELKDAAFGWLQARHVPESELRRLGISGPLESVDQCRYGLQLLALLCGQARRPLVLVLDQAEKFLVDTAGRLVPESAGFLHSLVEAIPDIGGMLVVAASEESWAQLPPDLRQRFGTNDVPCAPLQPNQAVELLGLYIFTALEVESQPGYRAARPYTDAAVEKMLRNSGGNLRALLQLGWQAFDAAAAGAEEIDVDDVPDDVLVLDRETVEMSVRRMLWRLGPLNLAPRPGFQYGVLLPGGTRLLVRLTEALFYLAEAERAEEDILARIRPDPEAGPPEPGTFGERHILIVIGYASADVRRLLERVYDEVFVYRDAESLARALQDLVGGAGPDQPNPARHETDLTEVYSELASLGWARAQHAEQLEHSVEGLGERYSSDQAVRRFEELASRWPAERDRTAARITDARRERTRADLAELHRLERGYQRREARVPTSATFLAGAAAVLIALFHPSIPALGVNVAVGVAVAAAVLLAVPAASAFGRLAVVPVPEPMSLAEAGRIARDRVGRAELSGIRLLRRAVRAPMARPTKGTSAFPADLRSGDPYRRYGYVLAGGVDRSRKHLRAALTTERVALTRRALADRLGRRLADEPWWQVVSPADTDLAELPYIAQHHRDAYWNEIAELDAGTRLLVALAAQDSGGIRAGGPASAFGTETGSVLRGSRGQRAGEGDFTGETDTGIRQVLRAHAGRGGLGEAYRAGLNRRALLRAAMEIEYHELLRIERLLSPFNGLGVHDHLRQAPEIEQLYLFFTQLIYFRDGGALGY